MSKKKAAKMGRPKKADGAKISQSVGFDPPVHCQLIKLQELTGKSFSKLVQEGGELVVELYRKKGFKI